MTSPSNDFPDYASEGTLSASDYNLELKSQIEIQRSYNMANRSAGIVYGLEVSIGPDLRSLLVTPGLALDNMGRPMSILTAVEVSTLNVFQLSGLLVIWLDEQYGAWRKYDKSSGDTRILSQAKVQAFESSDPLPENAIILTEFSMSNDGLLRSLSYQNRDLSVLKFSGIALPRPDAKDTEFNPDLPLAITTTEGPDLTGLSFQSPRMDLFGSLDVNGQISIGNIPAAAQGPGKAALSVSPPNAIAGTSRIGNEGANVYTSDGSTFGSITTGDQLIFQPSATDLAAGAFVATVKHVQNASSLTVEKAPGFNTSEINFSYKMHKLLRVVDGYGRTGLVATVEGSISIGDAPATLVSELAAYSATLNILGGDVLLGSGQSLKFSRTGWIRTPDYNVTLGTYPGSGPLILSAQGGLSIFTLNTGANATPNLILTPAQNVGIGLSAPQFKLSVNGMIKADGLVFPDGSIQTKSVIPIPIGTVIDWWAPEGQTGFSQDGFQICDGSQITDKDSPLVGQATPNLSDLMIRGVTAYADISKTGGTATHTHTYQEAVHTHNIAHSHAATGSTDDSNSGAGDDIVGSSIAPKDHVHEIDLETSADSGLTSQQNTAIPPQTTEPATNLPPYMYALKVMRIK